jgi:hypothetical protein
MEGVLYSMLYHNRKKKDPNSVLTIGVFMSDLLKLMHQSGNPYRFAEVN